MKLISCPRADGLAGHIPNLIVFPEHVDQGEITRAEELWPNAMVTGAVAHDRGMRGVLRHGGRDRISYMKMLDDDRSIGAHRQPDPVPVYDSGDLAVGLLICLDIQEPTLVGRVLAELRMRTARFKVICVPAAMHASSWSFQDGFDLLGHAGINAVVLTNGEPTHPSDRMGSFIFDQTNLVRCTEEPGRKAICLDLS